MQAGVDMWAASGFLAMSMKTLTSTYGHHHPDWLRGAAEAFRRRRANGAFTHGARSCQGWGRGFESHRPLQLDPLLERMCPHQRSKERLAMDRVIR